MFKPVNVCVPVPDFVRFRLPAVPLTRVPAKDELPEATLSVRVETVALPSSTVPEPVRPAMVGEKPLSRRVAPLATLTAFEPDGLRAFEPPSCSTPPFTARPPVKELLPASTSVPRYSLLNGKVPEIGALIVTVPMVAAFVLTAPTWIASEPESVG